MYGYIVLRRPVARSESFPKITSKKMIILATTSHTLVEGFKEKSRQDVSTYTC